MLSVLLIILPIFALILAGWGARRMGVLGPQAATEINRFVVWLALPALLFGIMAKAHWGEVWQPDFIGTFVGGALAVFVLTLLWRRRSRPLADAAIDGLNAGYANTAFLGFPLMLAVFGSAGLAPTLIATILTVCVLFAGALIVVDIGLQTGGSKRAMLANLLKSLARNPLVLSPAAGALFLLAGWELPAPVDRFVTLLGGAASPCALVGLGLFLADAPAGKAAAGRVVAALVALKLLVQPLLTWLLAAHVFHLSPAMTGAAVLLAALPTGTGPFMAAEFHGREAGVTARVILLSTILSLATLTVLLTVIG
ncbi:AEC family transporter [Altererythrobacter xixiisoli]|uniref:AEC family transporter n=1 Tax=Croceibacterium xixiisoli TaxID=1476466 RepID=A0A6I4TVH1_9SPHN|nr:AEC family transporter [Croceibacterium xixiisoli]MXO98588.1 AEC family transporter [Croceibacterium xixiisoli]